MRSAALGSEWHAIGHSRSLEPGLAHPRVGAFAAAASERRVDDEQQAVDESCRDQRPGQEKRPRGSDEFRERNGSVVDESAVRRAGLVRLSRTTPQILSADNI